MGETDYARVEVRRVDRPGAGSAAWSVCLAVREADVLVRLPGHYGAVLAGRLRDAERALAAGAFGGVHRTYRDEFLDLTAVDRDDGRAVALTSSARSPFRVSLLVPETELAPLAALLADADELVETLRQGLALVPDRLPDDFAER